MDNKMRKERKRKETFDDEKTIKELGMDENKREVVVRRYKDYDWSTSWELHI